MDLLHKAMKVIDNFCYLYKKVIKIHVSASFAGAISVAYSPSQELQSSSESLLL